MPKLHKNNFDRPNAQLTTENDIRGKSVINTNHIYLLYLFNVARDVGTTSISSLGTQPA